MVTAMNGCSSRQGRMPAPFMTMISESVASLCRLWATATHQRDRRDHQDEVRDDQAGDADEHQDGLALAGHQVDVAQRLRHPDRARQADEHQQKRPKRGAKDVAAD